MNDLSTLRSYADIRKFTSTAAFSQALNFISWHNRLTFTPMLEPWEALVVTLAHEIRPIDGMFYTAMKGYLEERRHEPVLNLAQAKARSGELLARISA